MRKCKFEMLFQGYSQTVYFRPAYNSTHISFKTYVSFRRYTAVYLQHGGCIVERFTSMLPLVYTQTESKWGASDLPFISVLLRTYWSR